MPVFKNLHEFAEQCPESGVILGIDSGEKRIGLACSDKAQKIAFALETVSQSSDILALHHARDSIAFVLGFPRHLHGAIGASALRAEKLAHTLLETIPDIPLLLWDEWYSSAAMEKMLINEADLSRKKRKNAIDKLAASFILQGVLDGLQNLRK